jgi:uncharacterized membrane protein (UPF0127 family)
MHKKFYVYNETRQSFLSLGVDLADTHLKSLRGLLGKRKLRNDEGLWMVPSQGIHTIGVLFPIDVIYLDAEQKVIHLVEHLPPFRIGPLRPSCESVLQMPTKTIYSSQTQIGDRFLICSPDEIEDHSGESKSDLQEVTGVRGRWTMFRKWVKSWISAMRERRASARMSIPLVAYYWNGGVSQAYPVNSVSAVGAYLVTPDRWYPGTVVRLTFQYDAEYLQSTPIMGDPASAVTVRAKFIRSGPDGVGVQLIHLNDQDRHDFHKFLAGARPRRIA